MNTNASASAFGWEFQSNAAIVLMIKNIKDAISIKVEGKTEDIELFLNNGNVVYSQAKSVFNPDDCSNVKKKLQEGLKTLNAAARNSNVAKLIYITNSHNPFNDIRSMPYFYGFSRLSFHELPKSCQSKIKEIINKYVYDAIDINNFEIHVLPFYGDGENRYKIIKEVIYEFLRMIGMDNSGLGCELLETWQRLFANNASQHNLNATISKKNFAWPLIVSICELRDDSLLNAYDDGELEEISTRYKDVINNNSERFEFLTKVINEYTYFYNYDNTCPNNKINSFINSNWQYFKDEFDIENIEPKILKAITQLTIHKILSSRYTISRIKKDINLL